MGDLRKNRVLKMTVAATMVAATIGWLAVSPASAVVTTTTATYTCVFDDDSPSSQVLELTVTVDAPDEVTTGETFPVTISWTAEVLIPVILFTTYTSWDIDATADVSGAVANPVSVPLPSDTFPLEMGTTQTVGGSATVQVTAGPTPGAIDYVAGAIQNTAVWQTLAFPPVTNACTCETETTALGTTTVVADVEVQDTPPLVNDPPPTPAPAPTPPVVRAATQTQPAQPISATANFAG